MNRPHSPEHSGVDPGGQRAPLRGRLVHMLRVAAREYHRVPSFALGRVTEHWRTRFDVWAAAEIMSRLSRERDTSDAWRIDRVERPRWARTGVTVVMVRPQSGPPQLAVRLPHTDEGTSSLRRQRDVQVQLHADPRLSGWNVLVPRAMGEGRIRGRRYFVESVVSGLVALPQIKDPGASPRIQAAAAAAIGDLHRRTAEKIQVDRPALDRWVDRPLRVLGAAS